jgi:Mlc titration factor MtfA (ptsG expression regulator)
MLLQFIAILLLVVFICWLMYQWRSKKIAVPESFPESYRKILNDHVSFYHALNDTNKAVFEKRILLFLSKIKITGVQTVVEDIDKVFIAAGAIIPVFAFPDWEYNNLHEVLLYPNSFNEEFALQGQERNVLGMVGSGAMQHVMILSQPSLRQSFLNQSDKNNTAIHEFVHLIDKTDGDVDGIPETLLSKQYVLPWINMMHQQIKEIVAAHSDINPYGATNQGEFFAVVSEYFFEQPGLLKANHPELYQLLEQVFHQEPKTK